MVINMRVFWQDIEDSRWQFLITGGIDFGMPLTVFQVNIIVVEEILFEL